MTPAEERDFMAAIERRWNRESWYRRPDGRLDRLALEGYVLMAIMLATLVLLVVQGLAK